MPTLVVGGTLKADLLRTDGENSFRYKTSLYVAESLFKRFSYGLMKEQALQIKISYCFISNFELFCSSLTNQAQIGEKNVC